MVGKMVVVCMKCGAVGVGNMVGEKCPCGGKIIRYIKKRKVILQWPVRWN